MLFFVAKPFFSCYNELDIGDTRFVPTGMKCRMCSDSGQLSLIRITHQVSRAFDLKQSKTIYRK